MDSGDAMVWAEEFCRIFKGYTITDSATMTLDIDEGNMVGWFANAMARGEQTALERLSEDGPYHAFLHFYHLDKSNAAFHCANVRFSPVTFRLAEHLRDAHHMEALTSDELAHVLMELHTYEEDRGR
jgi:hypothetical protein